MYCDIKSKGQSGEGYPKTRYIMWYHLWTTPTLKKEERKTNIEQKYIVQKIEFSWIFFSSLKLIFLYLLKINHKATTLDIFFNTAIQKRKRRKSTKNISVKNIFLIYSFFLTLQFYDYFFSSKNNRKYLKIAHKKLYSK